MQTLGLSSEEKRSDGRLKSIFWPTVENAWDVNYLGQQGFWICFIIGMFRLVVFISVVRSPVLLVVGLGAAAIFLLGGIGVREASWPAAAIVFTVFVVDMVETLARGTPPGVVSIIVAAILPSNVRGAFLASEWRPAGPDEDRPTRFNESFRDKLVDQLPPKVWPIAKVPFFIISALNLVLVFAGFAIQITHRLGPI